MQAPRSISNFKQASSGWEALVSYILDKGLFPRSLDLVFSKLGIKFPMRFSIDLKVCRSPISFPLISIIESAFRQSQNYCSRRWKPYLNPLLAYAAAAERMMWAIADLPAPRSRRFAMVVESSILPVYMNVFDVKSGSCWKPKAACCAAINALVVLTWKSRLKSAKGRPRGSSGSFDVTAAAPGCQRGLGKGLPQGTCLPL